MRKIALGFICVSIVLLSSCGGEQTPQESILKEDVIIKNDNALNFAIYEKYSTLDPIHTTDVVTFHVLGKIYEPLLRFDETDLTIKPLLAESWEISENNLTYTFKLKKGVFFQNNNCFADGKGREIKASDVIYSFKRIYLTPSSYAYNLLKNTIVGGDNYQEGDLLGVKALDDHTVEFALSKPSSNFINLLALTNSSIVAKEAIEKNAVVGSGPFVYNKNKDTEEALTLVKNKSYHIIDKNGERLPHLDGVVYNYVRSGKEQVDLFMSHKLDVITKIPPSSVKKIVENQIAEFQSKPVKYVLVGTPKMATSFLSLNTAIAPFNNVKIRKAVSMAIDKTKIVDQTLKGEASEIGAYGVVPPTIKDYDYSSVVGLEYNVKKAKTLLAGEGFPNGEGFPTLTFSIVEGNLNLRVALEIQKQLLSNLNINVEISSLPLTEVTRLNSLSETNISLSSWLGEFPDPVTFLSLLYGGSVPNSIKENSFPNESRFKHNKFDELYEKALITIDTKERYELCLAADQIVATEVPIIPLWHHENNQLIQSSVKGYQENALTTQYITNVKLIPLKKQNK